MYANAEAISPNEAPAAKRLYQAVLGMIRANSVTAAERCAREYTSTCPRGTRQDAMADMFVEAERVKVIQAKRAKARKVPAHERITGILLDRALGEIRQRGLTVPYVREYEVADRAPNEHMCLIRGWGWAEYTTHIGYGRNARWLYGQDDNGPWAVRVPVTCRNVQEAVEWLTPAAVRHAVEAGRWVGRQGDVYLIELRAGKNNLQAIEWTRHRFDAATGRLCHPEHQALVVPSYVKAVKAVSQTIWGYQAD